MAMSSENKNLSKLRHDIKSPLTAIIGFADMIGVLLKTRGNLDATAQTKIQDYAKRIKDAAKDIDALSDKL